MKEKKGFTLTELLAIIVIIAIIAVITVPIILNVIENAKKGSIIDSAYGYKDSINKFYFLQLQENQDFQLNGTYSVIDGKLMSETNEELDIVFSGNKPLSGNAQYENNNLKSACLTYDNYKAIWSNNKFIVESGNCDSYNTSNLLAQEITEYNNTYNASKYESCYAFNETTKTITGFSGLGTSATDFLEKCVTSDKKLIIPASINSVNVEHIGDIAFEYLFARNLGITTLIFPPALTTIGDGAFANAPTCTGSVIVHLDFSYVSDLSIGYGAFTGVSLATLTIPGTVKNIGAKAFYNVKLANNTLILENGIESIGDNAFADNRISEVIIPKSVTNIGKGVFDNNFSLITAYVEEYSEKPSGWDSNWFISGNTIDNSNIYWRYDIELGTSIDF